MKLNHLTDDDLLHVFFQLPIVDLFHLNHTCSRWYHLQRVACKTRKTLTFLTGLNPIAFIKTNPHIGRDILADKGTSAIDLLQVNLENPTEFALKTAQLFTNLTTLRVCINTLNTSVFESINSLLCFRSAKLTTFKVWFDISPYSFAIEPELAKLLSIINFALPALRVLSIEQNNCLFSNLQIDMPILGRIEEFTYGPNYEPLCNSLKRYAEGNTNLKTITMYPNYQTTNLWIRQLNPQFLAKFTTLPFCLPYPVLPEDLHDLVIQFPSLKIIKIEINDEKNTKSILHALSLLKQLHELELDLNYLNDFSLETFDDVPQLPFIKTLKLQFWTYNRQLAIRPHFQLIFPNIERIHLKNQEKYFESCEDCLRNPGYFSTMFLAPMFHLPLPESLRSVELEDERSICEVKLNREELEQILK